MTPFVHLTATAAPLPLANVDTDKILPAKFLTTISRQGLASGLFATLREEPEFVLNVPPWQKAEILVALQNFGSGSSREHAPWALLDFGIRCIIAPSFADIFFNNCFANGMLPVVLPEADVQKILAAVSDAESAQITVDLPSQTVTTNRGVYRFDIDPGRKQDLLEGADAIARSLGVADQILAHERAAAAARPWLRPISPPYELRILTNLTTMDR